MDDRTNAIEEIIRQAQAKGQFADLPGQGRPLDLQQNLFAPDKQLAHNLIQNNGFTLPWIADRQEITAELAGWRQKLGTAWRQRHNGPAWEKHWQEVAAAFRHEAGKLNGRILAYNLKAPADSQHLFAINVEAELERLPQSPPEDDPGWTDKTPGSPAHSQALPAPSLRERALGYIRSLRRRNGP
jgi:hypothetical protein